MRKTAHRRSTIEPTQGRHLAPASLESDFVRNGSTRGIVRFPCSTAQQRFWFEEQLHPGNAGLNIAVRWRLDGVVEMCDLEQAWSVLIARHDALRTSFAMEDGEMMGVVHPHAASVIPVVDLRDLPEAEALAEAERLAQSEAQRTFDLANAPLIRVTLVRLSEQIAMLLVTAHHTICDGWSIGILAREMGELCDAVHAGRLAQLPALALTYADYAKRQRQWLATESFDAENENLKRTLAGYKQFEVLPDRKRPAVQTSEGNIVSILLDKELVAGLGAIARSNGCTLFMAALAALFALLKRYTGEDDIALGTQVSGRDEVELERLVGCFTNTIALRGDVSGDPTFVQLLERTRDSVVDAFEMRHVPLERMIEVLNPGRDLSRNALFSTNFIFQRSFIVNADYGTFSLVDLPSRSAGALYDLNFFMVERPEGWRASCEFNSDLFEEKTVAAMLERFQTLLRGVVDHPNGVVSALPLLVDADRQLLAEMNRTAVDYPADITLPQLFEARVASSPDSTALVCGERALTYAELDAASNRLARELLGRGLAPGARVGVFLDRSTDLVVALLAVHKAGCAYVPLDPAYPAERLAFIAQNSKLAATISRVTLRERLPLRGDSVVLVDVDAASIAAREAQRLDIAPSPDDLAYVIYTSGSTGLPKGVQIQHRALANLLMAMRERPGLGPDDVLVAVTTVSFDIAALELFLPLVVGAKLVLASHEDATDGAALLRLLQRSGATVMQATPVTWQLLLEAGWCGEPSLKMLCGGEAVPRALVSRLLHCGSDLWNMYGPTETTIWSSVLRLEAGDGPVHIGPPIANTQFYVLDAAGELVPPGVAGEVYIGGTGIALGYYDRPEQTQERFVSDRFSGVRGAKLYRTGDVVRMRERGEFEFLGRTDHQIKLRGFRIELGEIEAALLRQPGVAEAVAVVSEDAVGEKALLAFVVPESPLAERPEAWPAELRTQLGSFLPSYMVPSPIVVLPALPRTPNGKIDRRACVSQLPVPVAPADDATLTPTEQRLAELICELLGCEGLGRDTDIFSIGFHSLLAVRLTARIAQTFGIKVPLRTLFDFPTVAGLAKRIDVPPETDESPAHGAAVTLNQEGTRPPFVFLHSDLFADGIYCRRLATAVGPAQPFLAIAPHGTHDLPLLPTIEAMARDYVLRIRALQPEGPYRIGGFCVSGLVAYEVARLLRDAGNTVDDVVLINASTLPQRAIPPFDWIVRKVGLDARLSTRLRDNVCYNVARLHGAVLEGPRGILDFVRGRIRALFDHGGNALQTAEPLPFVKRRGTRETENSFAHLVAALTYHPKPYDGHVTLIWGTDQEPTKGNDTMGWSAVSSDVRVVPMTGGHVSPLRDRVEELGHVLDDLLSERHA
jgi:amino acid adenylation domain-containing protein